MVIAKRSALRARGWRTATLCVSWSIVLAKILRHVLARHPPQCPPCGPLSRVGAGILDGHVVLECIEIGPPEPLDEMKLFSVRDATVCEPEPLVEALR